MRMMRIGACVTAFAVSVVHLTAGDNPAPATSPAISPTTQSAGGELWILSGQSNACAKRPGKFSPPVTDKIKWYDASAGTWGVLEGDLRGMTRTGRAGPFHTAAYEVVRRGIEVRMLGYSRGGASIQHWLHRRDNSGLKLLEKAVAPAGQGAGVFIWYQGESNNSSPAQTYRRDLGKLVAGVRKMADKPDMLVVIVQLGNWKKIDRGQFYAIREAQRQFVMADRNAVLVPALGRPLADNVHLTPESQAKLGVEVGRAILKARRLDPDVNWPGPVLDAASLTGPGTVVAHFAEVTKLSGITPSDFKVLDAGGEVACTAAKAGATTVSLTLARAAKLPARLAYAYEQDPAATLRDEAGNHAPAALVDVAEGDRIDDRPTKMPNGAGPSPEGDRQ